MDTPPPLPTQRSTFYHQAATRCLLAPFVAIGVNVMLMMSRASNPPTSRAEILVPALILGGIMLTGAALGVISLFGIRRYGRAGILWKAIIGLSIFALLFVSAIPPLLKVREAARQRHKQIYGESVP